MTFVGEMTPSSGFWGNAPHPTSPVGTFGCHSTPDVVVLDLTVWKVPEDPFMLDTESTTSK